MTFGAPSLCGMLSSLPRLCPSESSSISHLRVAKTEKRLLPVLGGKATPGEPLAWPTALCPWACTHPTRTAMRCVFSATSGRMTNPAGRHKPTAHAQFRHRLLVSPSDTAVDGSICSSYRRANGDLEGRNLHRFKEQRGVGPRASEVHLGRSRTSFCAWAECSEPGDLWAVTRVRTNWPMAEGYGQGGQAFLEHTACREEREGAKSRSHAFCSGLHTGLSASSLSPLICPAISSQGQSQTGQ